MQPLATVFLASEDTDAEKIGTWFAEVLHTKPTVICVKLGEFTHGDHCVELTGWPPGFKGYTEPTPLQAAIEDSELPIMIFKGLHLSHDSVQSVLRSYIEPPPAGSWATPRVDLKRSVLLVSGHYPIPSDIEVTPRDVSALERALINCGVDAGLLDRFEHIVKV